jgi:hypothetical protein
MNQKGRFERVWAGERETRFRVPVPMPAGGDGDVVVTAYQLWTDQLMAGARPYPTLRTVTLRKLHVTEGYREALRQAPGEHIALFGIWDAAYRALEHLHWELAPPSIDPPPPLPPPTFAEVRSQYKAMTRERARRAEERTTHWHPLDIALDPVVTLPDEPRDEEPDDGAE